MMKNIATISLFTILLVLGRLIDHSPNFTPTIAISLLAGYYLKDYWAYLVPIIGMFISNCFLGHYDPLLSMVIYSSLLVPVSLGNLSSKKVHIGLSALGSALLFFLASNLTVWFNSELYGHDLKGLVACYVAAIPFFKNTFLSTIIYTTGLFCIVEICKDIKYGIVAKWKCI